jgi:hypothetical protein
VPARERSRLERDDETHRGVVDERPGAGTVRQHERALQFSEPRVVDPRAGKESEPGVDAVDGLSGSDHAIDRARGGVDRPTSPRIDRDRLRLVPETAELRERESSRGELERLHWRRA